MTRSLDSIGICSEFERFHEIPKVDSQPFFGVLTSFHIMSLRQVFCFQSFHRVSSQSLLAASWTQFPELFQGCQDSAQTCFLLIWWIASKFLCSMESLVTEIKPCLRNCLFVTDARSPFGSRGHNLVSQRKMYMTLTCPTPPHPNPCTYLQCKI